MVRSITIKTEYVAEMIEVYGEAWEAVLPGEIPNPQSKADFAAEQFDSEWKAQVKHRVWSYRKRVAYSTLDNTEITDLENFKMKNNYYIMDLLKAWDFTQAKTLLIGAISGTVTILATFSKDYLGISGVFALALLLAILVDFITGIAAARFENQIITSRRGLRSLYKSGAYIVFLFIAFSLAKEIPNGLFQSVIKYFHIYLLIHVSFWELFSIDENLKRMGINLGLTTFLHEILDKIQGLLLNKKNDDDDE